MSQNLPQNYTLEQAETIYQETRVNYERVRKNYEGILNKFRKNLRPEDNKTLQKCISTLLPLTLEYAVQEELNTSHHGPNTPDRQFPLFYRITQLQSKILFYASRFKNSGVKRSNGNIFE